VLYLLLGGEFIAATQIIVYAGAIMVLFIFVIMLLNAGAEQKVNKTLIASLLAAPLVVGFAALMAYLVQRLPSASTPVHFGDFTGGSARDMGMAIFTRYVLPFEVTSVLIVIAILGAIVLARKELD
jgi:NADH-quinone oxidoreductase subunit J